MLKGCLTGQSWKCFPQLLDTAETFSQLDAIEEIDESEEMNLNEDFRVETEENALHEEQIKNVASTVKHRTKTQILKTMEILKTKFGTWHMAQAPTKEIS